MSTENTENTETVKNENVNETNQEENLETVQTDEVVETAPEADKQTNTDDKLLNEALSRIALFEKKEQELNNEVEKWKSMSRKNETSLKEIKREGNIKSIIESYNLPDEAREFLKGSTPEELEESAAKISAVFGSKKEEVKKPFFTSQVQGKTSEPIRTSPLHEALGLIFDKK